MGVPFLENAPLYPEPGFYSPFLFQEELVFPAPPKQRPGKSTVQSPNYSGVVHQLEQGKPENPGQKKNSHTGNEDKQCKLVHSISSVHKSLQTHLQPRLKLLPLHVDSPKPKQFACTGSSAAG
jgi:hypothetical protein